MIFVVTTINYADRATLSIAGTRCRKRARPRRQSRWATSSRRSAGPMSLAQIPGGWLLDRFGSKRVYCGEHLPLVGLHAAAGRRRRAWQPATRGRRAVRAALLRRARPKRRRFPANGRIVAAWFPTAERGTASAIFNSAQYFATVCSRRSWAGSPTRFGWPTCSIVMGVVGLLLALSGSRSIYEPERSSARQRGRARAHRAGRRRWSTWTRRADAAACRGGRAGRHRGSCSRNRMLLGIYIGAVLHHDADLLLPDLVSGLSGQGARHVDPAGRASSPSLPAICGFLGGVLGGLFSDCAAAGAATR